MYFVLASVLAIFACQLSVIYTSDGDKCLQSNKCTPCISRAGCVFVRKRDGTLSCENQENLFTLEPKAVYRSLKRCQRVKLLMSKQQPSIQKHDKSPQHEQIFSMRDLLDAPAIGSKMEMKVLDTTPTQGKIMPTGGDNPKTHHSFYQTSTPSTRYSTESLTTSDITSTTGSSATTVSTFAVASSATTESTSTTESSSTTALTSATKSSTTELTSIPELFSTTESTSTTESPPSPTSTAKFVYNTDSTSTTELTSTTDYLIEPVMKATTLPTVELFTVVSKPSSRGDSASSNTTPYPITSRVKTYLTNTTDHPPNILSNTAPTSAIFTEDLPVEVGGLTINTSSATESSIPLSSVNSLLGRSEAGKKKVNASVAPDEQTGQESIHLSKSNDPFKGPVVTFVHLPNYKQSHQVGYPWINDPKKYDSIQADIVATMCRLETLFRQFGDISMLQIEEIPTYRIISFAIRNPILTYKTLCPLME